MEDAHPPLDGAAQRGVILKEQQVAETTHGASDAYGASGVHSALGA